VSWVDFGARTLPDFALLRERMINAQLAGRGIQDRYVMAAMGKVPREAFVAAALEEFAYADVPLPIDEEQTISQPHVVALMIEAAAVEPGDRVLEVGAGSGYAAAVLSQIANVVYAIERHPSLLEAARARLARLGYDNIEIRGGDGQGRLARKAAPRRIGRDAASALPTCPG